MKVSKVVLIVVMLHVLVIGGIFVFEGCSRAKAPTTPIADNESLPGTTNLTANGGTLTTVADGGLTPVTPVMPVAPVTPVTPVAPVTPTVPAKTHVVAKGDSLWKIAKAEKVTVAELAAANNLSQQSILKVGQKLTIPAATKTEIAALTPTTPATPTALTPVSTGGSAYEVRIGDSLWKIARDNGITVAALKQANNLKGDAIKVGQKLTIPAKNAPAPVATSAPVAAPAPAAGSLTPTITSPGTPATPAAPAATMMAPGIVLN